MSSALFHKPQRYGRTTASGYLFFASSLAMILGYYGRLPARSEYAWVRSSYPDRWVDHVARQTYDTRYEGTGNWPFNTAYGADRVGDGFVTRLTDLRDAERFVRAGIPLAAIAFMNREKKAKVPA